jgi:hypothetical protein
MDWEIVRTAPVFEAIVRTEPGNGGPPVHVHPSANESYGVLEGSLEVFLDGEWRTLHAGEKVVIPPGSPHTLKSHPDAPARFINVHDPTLDYEPFFRHFHRLVSSGRMKLPPTDPRSLLCVGVLFSAYPHLQRSVKPPQGVISALGFIGRRFGVKLEAASSPE